MTQSLKTKRQLQAEETYCRLLSVVFDLMNKKSYHEISVDEICATAGVSKGTFYHYFTSKQEILTHLSRKANTDILDSMAFDPKKSARQMFEEYTDKLAMAAEEVTGAGEARMLIALLTAGAAESYKEIEPQTQYVRRILEHGQRQGELMEGLDPNAANELICNAIQGAVTFWSVSQGGFNLKERFRYIFSPLWKK